MANYKITEFQKFLGNPPNTWRIYNRIIKNEPLLGLPVRNEKPLVGLDGKAQIYITVNPCRMMTSKPKISDITHWTCEYIDLDCERPDHTIPATDVELATLKSEIVIINKWLTEREFLTGYCDFTGNGFRWLLPIPIVDLRKLKTKDIIEINIKKKIWLKKLKSDTGTNIDTSVGELSRITGVPGTLNFKGHEDDRRREPFRGCKRVEDVALADYIIELEIPKGDLDAGEAIPFNGTANEALSVMMELDKGLETMINKAGLLKSGHRSEYDYAIALKLFKWKVSKSNVIDILSHHGTTKARKRPEYVRMTVKGAYIDSIIE